MAKRTANGTGTPKRQRKAKVKLPEPLSINGELFVSISAQELTDIPLCPMWAGRINLGQASVLTGETSVGKSVLATEIAACVTTGQPLPGQQSTPKGSVVWLCAEEHPARDVKPRLQAAGAVLISVQFPGWTQAGICPKRLRFPSGAQMLGDYCRAVGARFVFVDPIGSFLDAGMAEDSGFTAREVVQSLIDMAHASNVSVMFVKHPRKGGTGSALDQVAGNKEWVNAPRSAMIIGRDPNDAGLRILADLKPSKGKRVPSLSFVIEDRDGEPVVSWKGECGVTANDVFGLTVDAVEASVLTQGKELIIDLLNDGERPSREMFSAGEAAGVSQRTMNRAKKELGVTSSARGANTARYIAWVKPKDGWPKTGESF